MPELARADPPDRGPLSGRSRSLAALGMTAAGRPTASSLISPGVQDAPRPRKGPSLPVQSAVTTPSIFFQPGVRTRAALERRSS